MGFNRNGDKKLGISIFLRRCFFVFCLANMPITYTTAEDYIVDHPTKYHSICVENNTNRVIRVFVEWIFTDEAGKNFHSDLPPRSRSFYSIEHKQHKFFSFSLSDPIGNQYYLPGPKWAKIKYNGELSSDLSLRLGKTTSKAIRYRIERGVYNTNNPGSCEDDIALDKFVLNSYGDKIKLNRVL